MPAPPPAGQLDELASYAALADGAITAEHLAEPAEAGTHHAEERDRSTSTSTATSITTTTGTRDDRRARAAGDRAGPPRGQARRRRRPAAPGPGPQGLVPDHRGHAHRAPHRRRACRRRGHVRPPPRRDARPRRRVGLRQEHDRARHRPAVQADRRPHRVRRDGHLDRRREAAAAAPQPVPDDLPGPVRVAQPADDRRQHRRRAARRPQRRDEGRAARARPRAAVDRGPQPGLRHPLSARVLGRPAAAHRRRAGARARPRPDRRRRADLRARRVDPGAGHQPPRAAPGPARADVPVHRPRPVRRAPHQRPDRRDVPRPDRRAGAVARAQLAAAPPVLGRAPVGRADPGPEGRAPPPPDHPQGRRAVAGQPAVGLPLPHPVLAARAAGQPRALLRRGAAAARAVDGPRGRVPLRRGGRRVARAAPGDRVAAARTRCRPAGSRPRRPCR